MLGAQACKDNNWSRKKNFSSGIGNQKRHLHLKMLALSYFNIYKIGIVII